MNTSAPTVTCRPTLGYLIGTSDCGATLLAFVLDSHPMICVVGDIPKRTIRRRGESFVCSCGATVGECSFWQALFARLATDGIHFSDDVWPNAFGYLNSLANQLLIRHPDSAPRRLLQASLASVLPAHRRRVKRVSRTCIQFVRAALEHTRKQVFIDTSRGLFRFNELRRLDAWDFKVIRMVRDVRWFVYTKRDRLNPAEAAKHWRSYQLAADRVLQDIPAENQILVRYEDLCSEPASAATRIHAFFGLPQYDPPAEYDPAFHHVLGDGIVGRFTISRTERWRMELSPQACAAAMRIAGDVNERFGYPER